MSIHLQLRNYRKPALQRMVVRIMVMVPLYAVSSLISLFSVEAAFVIDAIRDIYEAFVIYCFFVLLLSYLGGERSLLIMLHGRPPKDPVFPVSLFKREIDVSDPYTFLFLKRGILQYVQVKPILAIATLILKACGKYNEGTLRWDSGYLYVSVIYNCSICLSLYCLAVFWMCVNDDLKPFRPVPKFLCVKGILFFSFWQALFISILASAGVITHLGPYTDQDLIALALTDALICLEMPLFAFAHAFAFSYTDFIDPSAQHAARMPMWYALRDAFGLRDVIADSRDTLAGRGMDYRAFEPSEGYMHQGEGRARRIRAGLRYAEGGRRKYWLPQPAARTHVPPNEGGAAGRVRGALGKALGARDPLDDVHAPLMAAQEADVVHLAPDLAEAAASRQEANIWDATLEPRDGGEDADLYDVFFADPDELGDEELFAHSRRLVFGDYNYPVVDVSSETARRGVWDEEERVLRDERSAWYSPIRGAQGRASLEARERPRWEGYGAVGRSVPVSRPSLPDTTLASNRLVDHADNAGPVVADGTDAVKLKWTKANPHVRPPPSRTNSNVSQARARARPQHPPHRTSAASSPGSGSSMPTPRSPPGPSRRTSALPADAVDLVVADASAGAAQDQHSTGGAGSGLRRVYVDSVNGDADESAGAGFVLEDDAEEEEQPEHSDYDPTDERDQPHIERGEDGREHEREGGPIGDPELEEGEREGVVARAQTPPAHARVEGFGFGRSVPSDGEDNPWA
ncbi:DUF300 domain-containing protein [Mycena crocata]|nr:DUF300 domain-containing protein [Mycena crocata]